MVLSTNSNNTVTTRCVTLISNPYTNPLNNLPWALAQDNRGFEYQIALDALPPGITLDMVEQSQVWYVNNDSTAYRLVYYAGTSSNAITISGLDTGIVASGNTTASGETGYYISVYDTTTQSVTSTTTAYPITINTFAEGNGITLDTSGQLYIQSTGVYNVQFSIQFANSDTQDNDANVWLRMAPSGIVLNSTSTAFDIAFSNGLLSIPSKHSTISGHTIIAWNYVMTIPSGNYIQFWWSSESIKTSITTVPAGTSPVTPITPSVIATIQQVTNTVGSGTLPPSAALTAYIDTSVLTVSGFVYEGEALPGTATSASAWRISKVITSGTISMTYPSGNGGFQWIWDNRAGYTYS